ncbi:fumarylacetoacetate hydrolase family protein [Sphingobium algorifonticola]|uniref:FAA hydrolase family protein n=1 Tax=Sphingobium algorifonticola TaxID=2008318 RepID=A0A437J961_9SPHN|nr:fumarylacetoacetate hydrolase family protein [Sphingobium algorifonticola]RVT41940.1 FAA hydrolase family protein [Sphingobium algorifonticola]
MKLFRHGIEGHENPGVVADDGSLRDLTGIVADIAGDALSDTSLAILRGLDRDALPIVPAETRIGACVGRVGKLVCVGLNYVAHAAEAQQAAPAEPLLFLKATTAICGPYDTVMLAKHARKVDWEVELGVVIGSVCRYVTEEDATNYIAGYCVVNDVSDRFYQLEGTGQWVKGKSNDSYAPVGPWLVTRDEVENPSGRSIWLDVDGHRYQNGNTADMVFNVPQLVSYISNLMTLMPGDIIATGTPSGVGIGQQPHPIYLHAGQVMTLGIDGLGQQSQRVVDWTQ